MPREEHDLSSTLDWSLETDTILGPLHLGAAEKHYTGEGEVAKGVKEGRIREGSGEDKETF